MGSITGAEICSSARFLQKIEQLHGIAWEPGVHKANSASEFALAAPMGQLQLVSMLGATLSACAIYNAYDADND